MSHSPDHDAVSLEAVSTIFHELMKYNIRLAHGASRKLPDALTEAEECQQRAHWQVIINEALQRAAPTPQLIVRVTPEVAARVLYDNWSGLASLPSPARELASQGHFFSALRLLFEPDADLTKPPKPTPQPHVEVLETALRKINDIRNSIIGCQKMNWSEHIYPLVEALNEAGIEGQSYPEAREYVGTMLERTLAAENEADGLRTALKLAIDHIEHMAAFIWQQKLGYSFESLGEDMPGIKAALATAAEDKSDA